MIWWLNQNLKRIFEILMWPFPAASPWPGLIVSSMILAFILIVIYRATSDQDAILLHRNLLFARTLELLLFQHDLRVSFSACGRILVANLRYLLSMMRPILFSGIPLLLLLTHQHDWFAYRPLRVGERAVFTAALSPSNPVVSADMKLTLSSNLRIDSPGVHVRSGNEVSWRIVPTDNGDGWIDVTVAGGTVRKDVDVGESVECVSTKRVSEGVLAELLSPTEEPLPVDEPVRWLSISYPPRDISLGNTEISWLSASVGLVVVFCLVFGRIVGVRVF